MRLRLATLVALALTGCGLPGGALPGGDAARSLRHGSQGPHTEALYPLVAGWQWRYQTTAHTGNQPEHPGADERFVISGVQVASGSTIAVMDRYYGNQQVPSTQIVRSKHDVTLSVSGHPEEGSITILEFPLVKAKSWPGRTWPQASESIQYVGTERIRVPAGTFTAARTDHTIHYANGTVDQLHYWYAPGIGMVKAVEGLTVDLGSGPELNQVTAVLSAYGTGSIAP